MAHGVVLWSMEPRHGQWDQAVGAVERESKRSQELKVSTASATRSSLAAARVPFKVSLVGRAPSCAEGGNLGPIAMASVAGSSWSGADLHDKHGRVVALACLVVEKLGQDGVASPLEALFECAFP